MTSLSHLDLSLALVSLTHLVFFSSKKTQKQWLGSAAAVAVPALVLAAIAVGAFAAKTYDSGADSVLLPASAEDRPAVVVPVEEFESKVREMQR